MIISGNTTGNVWYQPVIFITISDDTPGDISDNIW